MVICNTTGKQVSTEKVYSQKVTRVSDPEIEVQDILIIDQWCVLNRGISNNPILLPLYQKISHKAWFNLNMRKDRNPKGISHKDFVSEVANLLSSDQVQEIRKHAVLPKQVDPKVIERLIDLRSHIQLIHDAPGINMHLEDARRSLTSAIAHLQRKPWVPRIVEYSCVLNYDPEIGCTTCAIDEEDRRADSRCPLIRSHKGCWCRSDCAYWSGIDLYKRHYTDGAELNRNNTGGYETSEVWGIDT